MTGLVGTLGLAAAISAGVRPNDGRLPPNDAGEKIGQLTFEAVQAEERARELLNPPRSVRKAKAAEVEIGASEKALTQAITVAVKNAGPGAAQVPSSVEADLRAARTGDRAFRDSFDVDELDRAIAKKLLVIKIVHFTIGKQEPDCKTVAGISRDLPTLYELVATCSEPVKTAVLTLSQDTIAGEAGFVTPKSARACPHSAHVVICKNLPAGSAKVNLYAETDPPPSVGDSSTLRLTFAGGRALTLHGTAKQIAGPLQPVPPRPPRPPAPACNAQGVVAAQQPQVYQLVVTCPQAIIGVQVTAPAGKTVVNAGTFTPSTGFRQCAASANVTTCTGDALPPHATQFQVFVGTNPFPQPGDQLSLQFTETGGSPAAVQVTVGSG